MTAPARCEPPPEHRHHRWHWLLRTAARDSPAEPIPIRWTGKRWMLYMEESPEIVARLGWRYYAPAVPPELSE